MGHRLAPLLPVLLALTLRLLQEGTTGLVPGQGQGQGPQAAQAAPMDVDQGQGVGQAHEQGHEHGVEQAHGFDQDRRKELRSGCLKILSQLWIRFPDAVDYNDAWGPFLEAVVPLMPRMVVEAAGDK